MLAGIGVARGGEGGGGLRCCHEEDGGDGESAGGVGVESPYLLCSQQLARGFLVGGMSVLLTLGIGRRRTIRSKTKEEIATPIRKL